MASLRSIRVPFGRGHLRVPREGFRLDEVVPEGGQARVLDDAGIRTALDGLVHGPGIEEIFGGAGSALIAVPDSTRSAGTPLFLPHLVERIAGAGCKRISLAVASGLHRRPTEEEIGRILGPEVAGAFPVILHDPDDRSRLVEIGKTRAGTSVRVLADLLEHDRIVLTGAVGFHYYAGFSGGRKAVVPGLAARETIVGNHLRAVRRDGSRHPAACAGKLDGNPVHRDMAEGAALLRPAFLVNTVLDPSGGIERLFAGDWRRTHVAACRYLRRTRSVKLEPRDLVVVSAGGYPGDINLIQAHKAFEATMAALRPGGVLVLAASCADGAGHDDFLPAFDVPSVDDLLGRLMQDYRVYRQTALAWRRKLERCRLILVSGLGDAVVRRVGAMPARDMDEAMAAACRHLTPGSAGWVFPHGTRSLVVPVTGGGNPS